MDGNEIINIFEKNKMSLGRLLTLSKSLYRKDYPTHDVLFNANVFTLSNNKVWFGDIDFNFDAYKLQKICDEIGEELYVIEEILGRFENENLSQEKILEYAYAKFTPKSKFYDKRIFTNELTIIAVGSMNVVKNKYDGWEKIKIPKKTKNEFYG